MGVSFEGPYILGAIAIGIGATLLMDLWNLFLKSRFNIPSLSYCVLGRWLQYMPEGTLRHANINAAPKKPFECAVGWIAHYSIGVAFALGFVVLTSGDWLTRPTLLPAVLYGIATVVFPFFLMQPSFGLGIAASRTPRPMQARLKSLATHTVFGLGLYVCAVVVSLRPPLSHLRRRGSGLVPATARSITSGATSRYPGYLPIASRRWGAEVGCRTQRLPDGQSHRR